MGAGHSHPLYVHEHSRAHHLASEAKLAAAVAFVLAVALTPREAIWAFAFDALVVAALIRGSRVRLRFVAVRLVVVVPFVLAALVLPFVGEGRTTAVLGVELQREGALAAANIIAKATIGAGVSILLAATTTIPDLLRGAARLRVPAVLTAIAMFMVRYLEVVALELGRMRTAMVARGYVGRWLSQAQPVAAASAALFIRSYERGERVHAAMLARGYSGEMPDLGHPRASRRDWLHAAVPPALVALITGIAWGLQP